MVGAGAVVAQAFAGVGAEEHRAGVLEQRQQRCGSRLDTSRCSGAMRLLTAQASSIERVWISAPRPSSEARITAWRGISGSSRSIAALT